MNTTTPSGAQGSDTTTIGAQRSDAPYQPGKRITLDEFKALIDGCGTDLEVAREFHYHFEQINGTPFELLEALKYADERNVALSEKERAVA